MDTPRPTVLSEILALQYDTYCFLPWKRERKSVTNLACHPPNTLLPRRGFSGIVSLDELPVYYESPWENRICTAQGASSCYSIYQAQSQVLGFAAAPPESHKPAPLTGLLT